MTSSQSEKCINLFPRSANKPCYKVFANEEKHLSSVHQLLITEDELVVDILLELDGLISDLPSDENWIPSFRAFIFLIL